MNLKDAEKVYGNRTKKERIKVIDVWRLERGKLWAQDKGSKPGSRVFIFQLQSAPSVEGSSSLPDPKESVLKWSKKIIVVKKKTV